MVVHTFNPSTQEAEADHLCEFKASLVYRASSGFQSYRETLSQ